MPFNGSGVYQAPPLPASFNPATTGGSATPADWNTLLTDLSTALSTTITKDGQTTITADIPFATHKITGLGNATAQTDALNQRGALYVISQQDVAAVAFVDFTNIAATVNNIQCTYELRPDTNATDIGIQTYGADGILDTGGSDYSAQALLWLSTGATPTASGSVSSSILLASAVSSGTAGVGGSLHAENIQAATFTKFLSETTHFNSAATVGVGVKVSGWRAEADRITGIRISVSSGLFTGKVTLFGSV